MGKPKIVCIVGPTASGKTNLAVHLAKKFNGEVISADSRQVYKGLDLSSGKITSSEAQGIKHHLIDTVDINTVYTAADFLKDAKLAISDIHNRKKTVIVAGGTFFYIELLKNIRELPNIPPNPELRENLERETTDSLFQRLETLDNSFALKIDKNNRRRLIRALEIIEEKGFVPELEEKESDFDWFIIGINIDKEHLKNRISLRLKERLELGMINEIKDLLQKNVTEQRLYDLGLETRYILEYLKNKITLTDMENTLKNKISQFAKRQSTWLKRDKEIKWYNFPLSLKVIESDVKNFLDK